MPIASAYLLTTGIVIPALLSSIIFVFEEERKKVVKKTIHAI